LGVLALLEKWGVEPENVPTSWFASHSARM